MTLMQDRPKEQVELKVDWCSHEAAKYACLNWHYSKAIPVGKIVKVGAWENGKFIGCVLFSYGANNHIAQPYGMTQQEVVELTRIAMTKHISPVTQIMAKAIKMLKQQSPGLKLIVSYADSDQEHKGIIYQACNWIYEGLYNQGTRGAFIINGKKVHPKSLHSVGQKQSISWIRKNLDPKATEFITKGKHKYLMPLDKRTAKEIQKRAKPYPKK